jgi:hypothetical protein
MQNNADGQPILSISQFTFHFYPETKTYLVTFAEPGHQKKFSVISDSVLITNTWYHHALFGSEPDQESLQQLKDLVLEIHNKFTQ